MTKKIKLSDTFIDLIEQEYRIDRELYCFIRTKNPIKNKIKNIETLHHQKRNINKKMHQMTYYVKIKPKRKKHKKYDTIVCENVQEYDRYQQCYDMYRDKFKNAKDFSDMLYCNNSYTISERQKQQLVDRVRHKYEHENEPDYTKYDIMILINFDSQFPS